MTADRSPFKLRAFLPAGRRTRTYVGVVAALVLVVGLAVALGGSGASQQRELSVASQPAVNGSGSGGASSGGEGAHQDQPAGSSPAAAGAAGSAKYATSGSTGSEPSVDAAGVPVQGSTAAVTGGVDQSVGADDSSGSSAAATKIVKTGTINLSVPKGRVAATITRLSALASSEGGYVSTSRTNSGEFPSGSITLRIPVAKFGDALSVAASYGKVTNQSTHAQDVTGRYVDLNAQEQALEQTRSTYLTILSHATTIGATLAVQQRVDDVQQQIDELHGQIKVLDSQSSYSTLTAYVTQPGTPAQVVRHHERKGLAKAWHTSWSRFNRGIDAIVGAIGPIVLALLLLALIAVLIRLGYRAALRSEKETAPSPTQ